MEDFDEQKELQRIIELKEKQTNEILESNIVEQSCPESQQVVPLNNDYEMQVQSNSLVNEIMSNETALEMAKQKFEETKNQKNLAKSMGKVVNKKAHTDIESADLKVEQQRLANKVEKARQKKRTTTM